MLEIEWQDIENELQMSDCYQKFVGVIFLLQRWKKVVDSGDW